MWEVGYRYYDARGVEPAYPFGHGLSYAQFEYSNVRVLDGVEKAGTGTWTSTRTAHSISHPPPPFFTLDTLFQRRLSHHPPMSDP